MSGGSLDYAYSKVEDAASNIPGDTIERIAFKAHLLRVAKALKAVEWNLSGDGDDEEITLIRECLAPKDVLRTTIVEADRLLDTLRKEIAWAREDVA